MSLRSTVPLQTVLCYSVEIKTDEYKHRLYGNLQWALKAHQHPESLWTLWWFGSDISRIGSGMCTPGPQLVLLSGDVTYVGGGGSYNS